jgi:pentatricopeptide repeat protein
MTLRSIAFFVISILLLGACHQSRPSSVDTSDENEYDEARAMSHLISNPEYALTLIDSAYFDNNITDLRRQYLRAIVMYTGLDHPDSSMLICRHLVESEEWTELEDTAFVVDVYRLMATVAGTMDRPADIIHYAQLAADLIHGNPELRSDESDLLSRVGRAIALLGQQEEGMKLMTRASAEMDNSKSWINFMTYVNIVRKIAATQLEMNHPDSALLTLYSLMNKLNYFKAHAQEFDQLQQSMVQNPQAVDDYVNFNKVRCYASMINCFADLGQRDSAFHIMELMDEFRETQSVYTIIGIVPSLVKLHFDDWVSENIDTLFNALGADTLDMEYVRLLESMSELELHNENWKESNNYLLRASTVRDSVETIYIRNQLTDQLTLYQLQDERVNRMDAEARNRHLLYISIGLALTIVLLTLASLMWRIYLKFIKLKRVHVDTETELQEAKQQIEKLSQNYVPETPEQLYTRIMNIMESEHPYTDQDFDITELAALVHSNRTYISKVINKMSGLNFRSWLAKYRITLVQQYMKDNPKASLDELCEISGYASLSSLFRQFKAITGNTPIGWMSSIDEMVEEPSEQEKLEEEN